ncbi:MAG: choice-of-anchor Q domain-containing protein [Planctomycetota bacterium]
MMSTTRLLPLGLMLLCFACAPPRDWYVDVNADCLGSGTEQDPFCTIRRAIDAANSGDTILVRPGTYFEFIDFRGKDLVLKSTHGPRHTIIDGQSRGIVVRFESGETKASFLDGFTIQNGRNGRSNFGGGIFCDGSSPTISGNWILDNKVGSALAFGGGIGCTETASPRILKNWIARNVAHGNSSILAGGGFGGGIYAASPDTLILGNLIQENRAVDGSLVRNGKAIGGGIHALGCEIVNNTLVGNSVRAPHFIEDGSATYGADLVNCIVRANSPSGPVEVSTGTARFSCVPVGVDGPGNIQTSPEFLDINQDDYRLACSSPCIDAGDDSVLSLLVDFEGNARRVDGDSDGTSQIDIGAHEFDAEFRLIGLPISGGAPVRFGAQAPPGEAGNLAGVFLSLGDAAGGNGIVVPGSGGQRLNLDLDLFFGLWLNTPRVIRNMTLATCPEVAGAPFQIPSQVGPGTEVFYAGITLDLTTGQVPSVTPTRSLIIQ